VRLSTDPRAAVKGSVGYSSTGGGGGGGGGGGAGGGAGGPVQGAEGRPKWGVLWTSGSCRAV
jgi:hypothetical protein